MIKRLENWILSLLQIALMPCYKELRSIRDITEEMALDEEFDEAFESQCNYPAAGLIWLQTTRMSPSQLKTATIVTEALIRNAPTRKEESVQLIHGAVV